MRSLYTLDDPPPIDPPGAVVEATAWSVAADLWHDHHPDTLLGTDCARCRNTWPCPTWVVADGVIADVCATCPQLARAAVTTSTATTSTATTSTATSSIATSGTAITSTAAAGTDPVAAARHAVADDPTHPLAPPVLSTPPPAPVAPAAAPAVSAALTAPGSPVLPALRCAPVTVAQAGPAQSGRPAAPVPSPNALRPNLAAPDPVDAGLRYRRGRVTGANPADAATDFLPRVDSAPTSALVADQPMLGNLPRH